MIPSPYALVVFDWEGTLGDPLGHALQVLCTEAAQLGLPALEVSLARRYIPLGLDKAVKQLYPNFPLYQHERLLAAVQQALSAHHQEHYLFPGAKSLVQAIHAHGIQLAIATNKNASALQRALQTTELASFFAVTRAAGQAPAKPCPQMLEDIMMHCAVPPNATIMIGDSLSDIEMAVAAGVRSIGIDFYHQQAEALLNQGATYVVSDYSTLGQYLALPEALHDDWLNNGGDPL